MPTLPNSSFALTDELKALVNDAPAQGVAALVAAVSRDGKPVLSFRGSVQTYSDDQLGFWVRNSQGGTLDAIRANPNVALAYRLAAAPVLQFHGRARVVDDGPERLRVYENAPEREQAADPDQKGVAVIVDLDRVEGVLKVGPDRREPVKLVR